jgi:hypothetical protein
MSCEYKKSYIYFQYLLSSILFFKELDSCLSPQPASPSEDPELRRNDELWK